jgi:hypothetical protein
VRNPPSVVYRYYSPGAIPAVTDPSVRFLLPATFNDPFDVFPHFTIAERVPTGESANRQIILSMLDGEAESAAMQRFRNVGVCCFSETSTNLLMWAHHTEQHKGFAVGYASVGRCLRKSTSLPGSFSPFDTRLIVLAHSRRLTCATKTCS